MRAKIIQIPTFEELCKQSPKEIQDLIEESKDVNQSKNWHPEGSCYIHFKIVYNRARRTGNINMALAAYFHDLGKVRGTTFTPPAKYSAHGHEFGSLRLLEKYRNWVEGFGADYDIVHYIVKNHMRAKQIHQMRITKREAFQSEKYYPLVAEFTKFDDMRIDYSNDIN